MVGTPYSAAHRSALPAARWADHLNAAAAVVLVAFVGANAYYFPLYYAVQLWAAGLGPRVGRADLVVDYKFRRRDASRLGLASRKTA